MNRQQVYQSRSQPKSSGIEVSGILQRRGLVRSASEPTRQSEEKTKNNSWSESPLEKNYKPVPVRSERSSGAARSQQEKEDKPPIVGESGNYGLFDYETVNTYRSPVAQRSALARSASLPPFPPQKFQEHLAPALHGEMGRQGRAIGRIPERFPVGRIQAKLTIGQPNDKYEQEADRVASQVVQQINAPASTESPQEQTVQLQETQEEELQAKTEITSQPRQEERSEKLQPKLTLQGSEAISKRSATRCAGGETSADLTSASTGTGEWASVRSGLAGTDGAGDGGGF